MRIRLYLGAASVMVVILGVSASSHAANQFDYSWIDDSVQPQLALGSEIHDRVVSNGNSSCQTGFSQIADTINTIEELRDKGQERGTVFDNIRIFYPSLLYLQACRTEVESLCRLAADGSKLASHCAAYVRNEPDVEKLAVQNIPQLQGVFR